MKRPIILVAMLLLNAQLLQGKAGPVIPRPTQTVAEAVELAWDHFVNKRGLEEKERSRRKEFFVLSTHYETPMGRLRRQTGEVQEVEKGGDTEWTWYVTVIHPVTNGLSYTFRIMRDGAVLEAESTH